MNPQLRLNSDGSYSYGSDSLGWATSFNRDIAKQKYENGSFDPVPYTPLSTTPQVTNYQAGQTTPSGGFLSDIDAQELNQIGGTLNTIANGFLQLQQSFNNAQTQAEKDSLALQMETLTQQRLEAEKRLKEVQDAYGITSPKYTTQQIIGIIALSFGGLALIGALAYFIIKKTKK
jgi:hypothetical protein